ncbi:MAG: hypothetical protein IPK92_01075 [Nitrospira sp.]|jgi:hypothetical protein|nr:hypothetical protein [Nitrospira sp.]MBL8054331.1 hypothetical protein [Nitrospira sp.]
MWRLPLYFVAIRCLLFVASFVADATPNLSYLEKQAPIDAAQVEKVEGAAPNKPVADYSRYRMEEESNRLILAIVVMATELLALFLVLSYLKSIGGAQEALLTGSGLVLVIFATVLIVILIKRGEQLTAATEILEAIAGYLFGKAVNEPEAEQPTKS